MTGIVTEQTYTSGCSLDPRDALRLALCRHLYCVSPPLNTSCSLTACGVLDYGLNVWKIFVIVCVETCERLCVCKCVRGHEYGRQWQRKTHKLRL